VKSPDEVRSEAKRRFANRYKDWLIRDVEEDQPQASPWLQEFSLGVPTEHQADGRLEDVRRWIAEWRSWTGPGTVTWVERRWRLIGTQNVPERLVFSTPEELADFVDEHARWQRMLRVSQDLVSNWPSLKRGIARWASLLADCVDHDLVRLISMLRWIESHPESRLYVRQLPIPGMDTKWIEQRTGMIAALLHDIRVDRDGTKGFYEACGLRPLPQYVRVRILDPALREMAGGLGDITGTIDQIGSWNIFPDAVLIVENVQTGLAFDDMPGTVVIMGLGYSVDLLQKLPWVHSARCYYWGDLDTHGFAILNRARGYIAQLNSILMDQGTLLAHRDLWVEERQPAAADVLPLLTPTEEAVYTGLKQNVWGNHVRLEQERISWDFAQTALALEFG
jgi:hypothetical protein